MSMQMFSAPRTVLPRGPGSSVLTLEPRSFRRAAVSVDPFYEMLAARKKWISVKKKQEQP